MKTLVIDIETSPLLVDVWDIWNQNVGLNQIHEKSSVICFAAKWAGEREVMFRSDFHDGHENTLDWAHYLFDQADAVVTWNGDKFDIPHLHREFLLAGMPPPAPFKSIDLLKTMKRRFRFVSNKLDNIAQELGVGQKVKHPGHALWKSCVYDRDPKAWELMKRYNIGDVKITEKVHNKLLPWISSYPSLALFDKDLTGCPRCGSPKLQRRGEQTTALGVYQRFQCQKCGAWSRSGKRLHGIDLRGVAS